MDELPALHELPDGGVDTPYGKLYRPLSEGRQMLVFVAAFFCAPMVGHAVGRLLSDLSESARTALYVPYVLVFFVGYALWVARLNVIAFEGLGRGLVKALFTLIVLRRKPQRVEEVLPSKQTLLKMLVRAQRAGASFAPVGWLIGVCAGVMALLFESGTGPAQRFGLVAGSCVLFGHLLARLGRRGWLPFAEEG